MFNYAWKLMWTKKSRVFLTIFCMAISLMVILVAYNVNAQVEEGLTSKTYYDTVVGHSGSSSQLVMNALYFSEKPLDTIDYEYYEQIKADKRVVKAVPMGMGDSYKGCKLVGTNTDFFENYEVREGTLFNNVQEVVLGSNVATRYKLAIGDEIHTTHGTTEGGLEHQEGYKVVGILKTTGTTVDNVLFCDISSIWHAHGMEHTEDHEEVEEFEEENQEHEHEQEHEHGGLTAILVKCKSLSEQMLFVQDLTNDTNMQAVSPTVVMREILSNVDITTYIVTVMSVVIIMFGILTIYVLMLLNLYDSQHDMKLMRLIGISSKRVNILYLIQNVIIGVIAIFIGIVGRIGIMLGIAGICETKGIILNIGKIYPMEIIFIIILFVFMFLPSTIHRVIALRKVEL